MYMHTPMLFYIYPCLYPCVLCVRVDYVYINMCIHEGEGEREREREKKKEEKERERERQ